MGERDPACAGCKPGDVANAVLVLGDRFRLIGYRFHYHGSQNFICSMYVMLASLVYTDLRVIHNGLHGFGLRIQFDLLVLLAGIAEAVLRDGGLILSGPESHLLKLVDHGRHERFWEGLLPGSRLLGENIDNLRGIAFVGWHDSVRFDLRPSEPIKHPKFASLIQRRDAPVDTSGVTYAITLGASLPYISFGAQQSFHRVHKHLLLRHKAPLFLRWRKDGTQIEILLGTDDREGSSNLFRAHVKKSTVVKLKTKAWFVCSSIVVAFFVFYFAPDYFFTYFLVTLVRLKCFLVFSVDFVIK